MKRGDALVSECVGCGRPDGIYYAHRDEYLCSRCGTINELPDLAQLHLEQILDPIIEAWRKHWTGRGVDNSVLTELLEMYDEVDRSRHALVYRYNFTKSGA